MTTPTFADLGVDASIARTLRRSGINTPRPIQADTVAAGLAGRDVCGRAPTCSGKTLAFALPLSQMQRGDGHPVGLVLAPTRELALQITEVLRPLTHHNDLRVRTLIGGTSITKDTSALGRGIDIVVGCPGRSLNLLQRGDLDLSHVSLAVLDEADRMADMGFIPDVTRLLDATACRAGQLLLFSATLDDTTGALERRYQRDPVRVDVDHTPVAKGTVTHTWHVVDRQLRRSTTEKVLDRHNSAIVFTRTKRGADRLARQLGKAGHSAAAIHGDRSQNQRQRALARFATCEVKVLVATDIAARGIHVDDVNVVIHYDLPATAEDYTHRSGRTGRAGADGTVVAVVPSDMEDDAGSLRRSLSISPTVDGSFSPPATESGSDQGRPKQGRPKQGGPKQSRSKQSRPKHRHRSKGARSKGPRKHQR